METVDKFMKSSFIVGIIGVIVIFIGIANHIDCQIELIAVFIPIISQFISSNGQPLFQGFIGVSV